RLPGQRAHRGAGAARAARRQAGRVRLGRARRRRPRLRRSRARLRRPADAGRPADGDHRRDPPRQGAAQPGGARRPLVRQLQRRAGRGAAAGAAPMTYEESIATLAEAHPELMVLTAENRAAIRNLPARLGARFVDVGIAEQTMVGMAAGLALRGRRPIVHALAAFLTMRAFEFIRTDVGIAGLPVIFVGGVPGFLSEANGATHQAVEDVALMRAIPGMQIVCPADADELVAALPALLASGRPAYVRYHAGPALGGSRRGYALGRAEVVGAGSDVDVAILCYGLLVREALAARALLADEGA